MKLREVPGRVGVTVAMLVAAAAMLYAPILADLVLEWYHNENYSHGFLIVPAAAYFAWQKREALARLPLSPSSTGWILIGGGLATLLVGTAGIELFLTRVSIIPVLAGTVVFLFGWTYLRALAFPLALLLLMIPLPAIVFNQVAFPLQLLATKFGVYVLQTLEIPVLREGNVIVLATSTLEVAEACSGIRSLVSLVTLAVLFGYMSHPGAMARLVITCAAVPTAIVANGLRVAGTGVAAHHFGEEAATGFFHSFSGWLVFVAAFIMILVIDRAVRFVTHARSRQSTMAAAVLEVGQG